MELLPAIDLRGGEAVRLTQGDFDREERYGDPARSRRATSPPGREWIHVVDLDAARPVSPDERATLTRILGLAAGGGCAGRDGRGCADGRGRGRLARGRRVEGRARNGGSRAAGPGGALRPPLAGLVSRSASTIGCVPTVWRRLKGTDGWPDRDAPSASSRRVGGRTVRCRGGHGSGPRRHAARSRPRRSGDVARVHDPAPGCLRGGREHVGPGGAGSARGRWPAPGRRHRRQGHRRRPLQRGGGSGPCAASA